MAIAQYCSFGHASFSVGSVSDCLNKAQSALTEILMGDVELANLQVVLGLVIVFQGTSDIRPAVFLISTALRLCQVLGIHRSDSDLYGETTSRKALQLRRVFWIAYILDRDIAMRIRQAPIQQDTDISIEFPPKEPDDDAAGFVSTPEMCQPGFNVFRAYFELSQIQGYVYDALLSVRSQQLSPGERAANCQAIRLLLKDWKGRIPATLSAQALSQTQTFETKVPHSFGKSSFLIRPHFDNAQPSRMNICPYASGLVCLSANSIINFDHRDSLEEQDRRLKSEAVNVLGEMARQTKHKTLTKVLEAVMELDSQYQLMTA
ncbi:hypothetical protein SLS60_003546 [Paraconiothyrium brasiliense]|uniref:Xylanolytic transcriptional activator regulatory domain-containing protein n=1 Tax=Paraconiothyrium brasiliense TaxID=300254 RepID=A0ABR3RNY1_9PLEO